MRAGVSPTGGGGFTAAAAGGATEGDSDSDTDDTDASGDSDTDDDVDEEEEEHMDTEDEEEESEESDRRSSADAGNTRDATTVVNTRAEIGRNSDADGRVLWVLKSGEEVKLEGMDMTRNLRLRVGFAPVDGSSSCRFVRRPRAGGVVGLKTSGKGVDLAPKLLCCR